MKIENDTITFEPSDTSLLSPGLQKLLARYPDGNDGSPQGALNNAVAGTILRVKQRGAADALPELTKLAEAIAVADDTKAAQAQSLIDQVKVVLDVKEVAEIAAGLNPAAAKPVPK